MDGYLATLIIGVIVLAVGLLMMWRNWDFNEFVVGIGVVVTVVSLVSGFTLPALLGDSDDRLEVRVFNQMRDPVHVVITVNGTEVCNTNLDPPQWFNGDNNRHLFLHPDIIGKEPGKVTVSVNSEEAITLLGLWGIGDSIDITINADGTITIKDNNLEA